jgi:RNA-directed DNA polymerase
MRTSDVEGVAIHDGPESCAGTCEGDGEALRGVRAGQPLSREITASGCRRRLTRGEGHIISGVSASRLVDPARSSEPVHVRSPSAREPGGPAARPSG